MRQRSAAVPDDATNLAESRPPLPWPGRRHRPRRTQVHPPLRPLLPIASLVPRRHPVLDFRTPSAKPALMRGVSIAPKLTTGP